MNGFYLLSDRFSVDHHAPFAIATSLLLSELCGSRSSAGQIQVSISQLFNGEQTLEGAEPAGYEIGLWKCRSMCEDVPGGVVPEGAYFAWVSSMFWDCEPSLVMYTKAEFMVLFEDCCRNFVAYLKTPSPFNPKPIDRSEEFAQALAANGMSLTPTADRP